MILTHKAFLIALVFTLFLPTTQPHECSTPGGRAAHLLAPQAPGGDGPFDAIAQWFRDVGGEIKETIDRWKTIDLGEAIGKAIEDAFGSVGNLGKGIEHEMEKAVPGQ